MNLQPISYLRGLSSQVKKYSLVVVVALTLIVFVYPSAFIYSKDTLPDNNDTRLIAYIIGQVQKNLLEHKQLHYGTYFAPDQSTLAYSDLFLTSAVLTLPFRLFTHSPILIFSLALVIGSLLTIISSFLLFEYLFKDLWVTSLTVILFNFSGFHLHYLPHLQVFSLWPLFLSLYFFLRYLSENRLLFLYLFFLTVTIQLAESIFPVYLIFFAVIILFYTSFRTAKRDPESRNFGTNLYRFRVKPGMTTVSNVVQKLWRGPKSDPYNSFFLRTSKRLHFLSQMVVYSLPFIPLWIFLLYPYYHLHTSLPEATRPIRDAAHFSLGLDQIFTQYHSWTVIIFFVISGVVRVLSKIFGAAGALAKNRTDHVNVEKHYFEIPGMPRGTSRRESRQRRDVTVTREYGFWRGPKRYIFDPWNIILFFSIIMSLGPVLKIFGQNSRLFGFPIPLPYTLFYYLFPGFSGFRTPSRFIILALLAVCVLIGFLIQPIFEKLKSKTKFVFLLLVLSFLFWEADLPLKGYPVNISMHPVYQEVKNLPREAVILELPIKLWNMPDHEIESVRSLYSLEHNHRRFGGFSGFATNSWIDLVEKINADGLDDLNSAKLKSLGITYIIENNVLSPL